MIKKNKQNIAPNSGIVQKVFKPFGGVYYKNTQTGKFATKKDFIKSNYRQIIQTPLQFPKELKSAKSYNTYFNQLRFKGTVLPKKVQDFLKDSGFVKSDKKQIKDYQKEKGFIPDMDFIYSEKEIKKLLHNFFFTFTKTTKYNLDSGFLETKNGDLFNIVKEIYSYLKKGYQLKVIDLEGKEHNDITPIKSFEKLKLSEAESEANKEIKAKNWKRSKEEYIFNIEHNLTVNDMTKTVYLDLRDSDFYYS